MRTHSRRTGRTLVVGGISGAVVLAATAASAVTPTDVPIAQPKITGRTLPNKLASNLREIELVRGSHPLENPSEPVTTYGYLNDGPQLPAAGSTTEATKTEPDKNTFLRLKGQKGADPFYNYGTRFLFQGHEGGSVGYITRINLDADYDHRVTLLAKSDVHGATLPSFDGSTWDPFAKRLLLTAEHGPEGGVWQATLDVPSKVEDISGAVGRGGYEGVQNDNLGNVYLVEDVGGAKGTTYAHSRQPNSYVYKFVPNDRADLRKGGRLQVLQLTSLQTRSPILFHSGSVDADIASQDVADLHTYGNTFSTTWVTIHDTAADGMTPFDANALARPVGTPFKRPENGVFRAKTGFTQFFFTETGDTDATSEIGRAGGAFGAIFKLTQDGPAEDTGILQLFYLGDQAHTGLDNIAFTAANMLVAVEDAGDTLHSQRGFLDSGYLFKIGAAYDTGTLPVRFLAEGRDPSATLDSGFADSPGYQNDGDNEITGFHVSDGDATPAGILGAKTPVGFVRGAWNTFWTQQHGDNVTYRISPRR